MYFILVYCILSYYMIFTSLDFDTFLRSFCADSSSPQISAILLDNFTRANYSLRKSLRFSAKLAKIPKVQYHPDVYKTSLCKGGPRCASYYCPGAHAGGELRRKAPCGVGGSGGGGGGGPSAEARVETGGDAPGGDVPPPPRLCPEGKLSVIKYDL